MTESADAPHAPGGSRAMSVLFGVVIFLSAYLLFQVQPLISKSILPWFGGTPSVWTTCMLFFQLLLFGGYAYAHLLSSRLSPKAQLITHLAIMGLALLPGVLPDASWKPTGAENPALRIVFMLTASVGLPFFVLSSTGPLVQNWFSRAQRGRSPYHLYALSNLGSLLGLLLYPFYVEVAFDLPTQGGLWRWGFVAFVLGCAGCAFNFAAQDAGPGGAAEASESPERPTLGKRLLWFMLAAVPSTMLLATTNQVCLDVASIPFLWVFPLTLYLLTFILAFAGDRWYFRRTCAVLLPVALIGVVAVMFADASASLEIQLIAYFSGLFFTAMCCHGELARSRPAPQHLTSFYLWMSAGGAAGGLFVGLVAPYVFDLYLELHVAILMTFALMAVIWADLGNVRWWNIWQTPGIVYLSLGISVSFLLSHEVTQEKEQAILTTRNFYGVLRVKEQYKGDEWHARKLLNGRILHGTQYMAEDRRREATTYYCETSAVGIALLTHKIDQPRHIGVVGLGTGTVAAYGGALDRITYYEINEDVLAIAAAGARVFSNTYEEVEPPNTDPVYFSYLQDFPGEARVILGDARLSLERAPDEKFDVLVLDAFSSDAIPAHLLTREAIEVYLRHMQPDGILAVHISNRHFDLVHVVAAMAEEFQLADRYLYDVPDASGSSVSEWVLLGKKENTFASPVYDDMERMDRSVQVLWTDAYSNLAQVLKPRSWEQFSDDIDTLIEDLGLDEWFGGGSDEESEGDGDGGSDGDA